MEDAGRAPWRMRTAAGEARRWRQQPPVETCACNRQQDEQANWHTGGGWTDGRRNSGRATYTCPAGALAGERRCREEPVRSYSKVIAIAGDADGEARSISKRAWVAKFACSCIKRGSRSVSGIGSDGKSVSGIGSDVRSVFESEVMLGQFLDEKLKLGQFWNQTL